MRRSEYFLNFTLASDAETAAVLFLPAKRATFVIV
jgi:hypothetical protein